LQADSVHGEIVGEFCLKVKGFQRRNPLDTVWLAVYVRTKHPMPLPGDNMDAEEIKKIDGMFKRHVDVVAENIKHHLGVMYEDFQHKLDIVVEGHQMLAEKIDRMDVRLERVEDKVDAVTTDLAAHRADTEVHGTVYRVKESGE
jgi:hypothetical protein